MELLHNGMQVYLNYLKEIQEVHTKGELGIELENEDGETIKDDVAISDVLVESYVDAHQLRVKLVHLAGKDMTDG